MEDPNAAGTNQIEVNIPLMNRAQVTLVSKVAKIYGFKNLSDYTTKVSAKSLSQLPDFFEQLNQQTHEIDRLFPVHDINLRRTDYKVTSYTLAMNLLRSLLTSVYLPWESHRTRDTIAVKLVPHAHAQDHFMQIDTMSAVEAVDPITTCVTFEPDKVRPLFLNGDAPATGEACVEYLLPPKYLQYIKSIQLDGFAPASTYALVIGGSTVYVIANLEPNSSLLPSNIPCFPAIHMQQHEIRLRFIGVALDDHRGPGLPLVITYYPTVGAVAPVVGQCAWPPVCGHVEPCHKTDTWFRYISGMGGVMPGDVCTLYGPAEATQKRLCDSQKYLEIIPQYTVFSYDHSRSALLWEGLDKPADPDVLFKSQFYRLDLACLKRGMGFITLCDLGLIGLAVHSLVIEADQVGESESGSMVWYDAEVTEVTEVTDVTDVTAPAHPPRPLHERRKSYGISLSSTRYGVCENFVADPGSPGVYRCLSPSRQFRICNDLEIGWHGLQLRTLTCYVTGANMAWHTQPEFEITPDNIKAVSTVATKHPFDYGPSPL